MARNSTLQHGFVTISRNYPIFISRLKSTNVSASSPHLILKLNEYIRGCQAAVYLDA